MLHGANFLVFLLFFNFLAGVEVDKVSLLTHDVSSGNGLNIAGLIGTPLIQFRRLVDALGSMMMLELVFMCMLQIEYINNYMRDDYQYF